MHFAFLTPAPLLEMYATASCYHLVLEHLVAENRQYANFYAERKQRGDFVILDNSIIEKGAASSLIAIDRAAQLIQPDEIVLGERWHDAKGTLTEIENGIRFAEAHGWQCSLLAVPQGETLDEWLWCFERILQIDRVETIGVPRLLENFHPQGRYGVLRVLEERYKDKLNGKALHLLGLGGNPLEVAYAAHLQLPIRGVDSSVPVWFGLLGIPFDPQLGFPYGRNGIPAVDFEWSDTKHHAVVQHNIRVVNRWCRKEGLASEVVGRVAG